MAQSAEPVCPERQRTKLPHPRAHACGPPVAEQDASAPTNHEMNTQAPFNNKRKRASMEIEPTENTASRNVGTSAKVHHGDYDSAADHSFSHPTKRLKTTKDLPVGDDEVGPQSSTQEGTIEQEYKQNTYTGEEEQGGKEVDFDDEEDLKIPKPTKGRGKAVVKEKTEVKITNLSSKEEDEDAPTPKSAKGKGNMKSNPPRIPLSEAEIQAFLDGIPNIPNWSSNTGIQSDYCKIIEWFDKDKLDINEILEQWANLPKRKIVGKSPDKNIYKHYKNYAPKFYAEKGLVFATKDERKHYAAAEKQRAAGLLPKPKPKPKVRSAVSKNDSTGAKRRKGAKAAAPLHPNVQFAGSRAGPQFTAPNNLQVQPTGPLNYDDSDSSSENEQGSDQNELDTVVKEEVIMSPLIQHQLLEQLFAQASSLTPAPTSSRSRSRVIVRKKKNQLKQAIVSAATTTITTGLLKEDVARYFANRNSVDVVHFKHASADAMLGHPSRPVLDLQCAEQYSQYFMEAVQEGLKLRIVEYDDSIKEVTIARYVACVSPSLRKNLPTHGLLEVRRGELQAIEIQWSMQELKDLYEFARQMRAWDVVDMVMDRMHTELHRATPRVIKDEAGEKKPFDILDFSPDFINHLGAHDDPGLDFFTDILVMKGQDGWQHLLKYGLDIWEPVVKQILINKLQADTDPMVSVTDAEFICASFHHHHEHGWSCYNEQDPAPPVIDITPEAEPGREQEKLSPVASYWKRQDELHTIEQEKLKLAKASRPQDRKRKRPDPEQKALDVAKAVLNSRIHKRRKADKALQVEEDAMPSISISCYHDLEFEAFEHDPYYEEEIVHAPEVQEQPAFPGGLIFPVHLGNGTKDSRRMQIAKMKLVKQKLLKFERAGRDIGIIQGLDVDMSDEEEVEEAAEDEEGDDVEDGDVEDGEEEE